jgi:probable rRNA maturation factor
MDVFITNEQDEVEVDTDRLHQVTKIVLESENLDPSTEVSVICVDQSTMRSLNKQFLGIDEPTDVLAFPIDGEVEEESLDSAPGGRVASPDEAPFVLGDVVVCPAVAKRHAEAYNVPYEEEMDMLLVHGLLHLIGYDHATDSDQILMESRQRALLKKVAEICARKPAYPAAEESSGPRSASGEQPSPTREVE